MTVNEFVCFVRKAAFYGAVMGIATVCVLGLLLEWACRVVRRWSEK